MGDCMGSGRAVVEPFVEPFKEPFVEPLQSRCRAVHRDDAAVRRDDAEPSYSRRRAVRRVVRRDDAEPFVETMQSRS